MDMFARQHAPISGKAWDEIDAQAVRTLRATLSARRFVDLNGPLGWDRSCISDGTMSQFQRFGDVGYGVRGCIRLVESRVDFSIDTMELHNIDRGSDAPDLVPVERAAAAAAAFEDKLVYEGLHEAGISGMKGGSALPAMTLPTDAPDAFLRALDDMVRVFETEHGIAGPFALVGGKALRSTLHKIVSGRSWLEVASKNLPISDFVYTPSHDSAFIVSCRGGDLELSIGGDFAIGYNGREGRKLSFFITESAAFRVVEPRAFAELQL